MWQCLVPILRFLLNLFEDLPVFENHWATVWVPSDQSTSLSSSISIEYNYCYIYRCLPKIYTYALNNYKGNVYWYTFNVHLTAICCYSVHTFLGDTLYIPKFIMINDIVTFLFGLYCVDLRETSFILSICTFAILYGEIWRVFVFFSPA